MANRRRDKLRRMPPVQRWIIGHARSFFFSLGQLYRSPGNSLLTAAVIGIALALPASLYLVLENVRSLAGVPEAEAQLSVFLRQDVGAQAALVFGQRLARRADVRAVEHIPASDALADIRERLGLGDTLDALADNPLPEVLVVLPVAGSTTPGAVAALARELRALPEVDEVTADLAWLQRLRALVRTGTRLALLAGVLAGVGVILVVGNTIRLNVANRRAEIEIQQLFGATEPFIRRPFIYAGLIVGLLGGLLATTVCMAGLAWLQPAVDELLAQYGAGGRLRGPGVAGILVLVGAGALAGAIGARIAVGRHLGRAIVASR